MTRRRDEVTFDDIKRAIFNTWLGDEERGTAISLLVLLDDLLYNLLVRGLNDKIIKILDNPNTSSFKFKLGLLHALAIINDEIYDDLESLNWIRNRAAHHQTLEFPFQEENIKVGFTFIAPEIYDRCCALKVFQNPDVGEQYEKLVDEYIQNRNFGEPKSRFIVAVMHYVYTLHLRTQILQKIEARAFFGIDI